MKKIDHYLYLFILIVLSSNCSSQYEEQGYILTVTGKMATDEMGMTLTHEHVVTNFSGADKIAQPQYDEDYVINIILPHLKELKKKGINTIFECTPDYIGRDVELLKKLSELSGINIITNTGYYAAANKKYLPAHVYSESKETIAKRWEKEWEEGIDGTGIRPGFIKLGTGEGELDSIETKLLKAAVIVSKNTGLTIAIHTGDGEAAFSEYDIIVKEGWKGNKMIWVHAQNGSDEERIALAKKGVWISLDGISELRMEAFLTMVKFMKESNLLSKLLISHDDGWSVVNNSGNVELILFENGNTKPYNTIIIKFIDELYKTGFTKEEINRLLIENPKNAMAIRKRVLYCEGKNPD